MPWSLYISIVSYWKPAGISLTSPMMPQEIALSFLFTHRDAAMNRLKADMMITWPVLSKSSSGPDSMPSASTMSGLHLQYRNCLTKVTSLWGISIHNHGHCFTNFRKPTVERYHQNTICDRSTKLPQSVAHAGLGNFQYTWSLLRFEIILVDVLNLSSPYVVYLRWPCDCDVYFYVICTFIYHWQLVLLTPSIKNSMKLVE